MIDVKVRRYPPEPNKGVYCPLITLTIVVHKRKGMVDLNFYPNVLYVVGAFVFDARDELLGRPAKSSSEV